MAAYLILKLQGVMQAWGGHTYEDYRPSGLFPTRSGLVGLLAACVGIDRDAWADQQALAEGVRFAVRSDRLPGRSVRKITDFHTVKKARKVNGHKSKHPVVSRREYLCDACFTVAVEILSGYTYTVDQLAEAVAKPRFTPYLGRRSCPLGRPLFEQIVEAESLDDALEAVGGAGTVYTEQAMSDASVLRMRDIPRFGRSRQFHTRDVCIYQQEVADVSE